MRLSAGRSTGIAPQSTPDVVVVAPTWLEAWAARRALPRQTPVLRSGIGSGVKAPGSVGTVVVCGLAGALTGQLAPGTVLVPDTVALPSGDSVVCDPTLQQGFRRAARQLGLDASSASIVTLPTMITGAARQSWRERGFDAVDMESGLMAAPSRRLGVVRVVLDSPTHEISDEWMRPLSIVRRPRLWPQAAWLAWKAPRYALRAARVVARGLVLLDAGPRSTADE